MDFLLFCSLTKRNDLFKNILNFITKNKLFIHVHFLEIENVSLLDLVLNLSFNKENKIAFIHYIENQPRELSCKACTVFMT